MKTYKGRYFKLADPTNHYGNDGRYDTREDAARAIPDIRARQRERGYTPDFLVIILVEWETTYTEDGEFIRSSVIETLV